MKAGSSQAGAAHRRAVFIQAYLSNGHNATRAAIAAGFSPKTASVSGQRLLKHVKVAGELAVAAKTAASAAELTTENVLREIRRVSFSDTRKLFREDGTLKPPGEWDDDTAAAVGGLEIVEEFIGSGETKMHSGFTKKLKIWDKNAALDKAAKHLGLYEKDNVQVNRPVAITIVFE